MDFYVLVCFLHGRLQNDDVFVARNFANHSHHHIFHLNIHRQKIDQQYRIVVPTSVWQAGSFWAAYRCVWGCRWSDLRFFEMRVDGWEAAYRRNTRMKKRYRRNCREVLRATCWMLVVLRTYIYPYIRVF